MSIVIWDGFCSCSSDVGVRVSKFRLVVSLPFWVWCVVLEAFLPVGSLRDAVVLVWLLASIEGCHLQRGVVPPPRGNSVPFCCVFLGNNFVHRTGSTCQYVWNKLFVVFIEVMGLCFKVFVCGGAP